MIDARIDETRTPFATTGTTPAGSLDDVRHLSVVYADGFCLPGYDVRLDRTNEYDEAPVVSRIYIPTDMPPGATVASTATIEIGAHHQETTDRVVFEVAHIDVPDDRGLPLRIAGWVTVHVCAAGGFIPDNDGAWDFDFSLDATTARNTCI